MSLVQLINQNLSATIGPDGQLFSIQKDGVEYMHGAGKPDYLKEPRDRLGWDKSEIVMFPIIGKSNNNIVRVDGRNYPLDQHGISRALPFNHIPNGRDDNFALFRQKYDGGSVVNPKYKGEPSNPERMVWSPYSIEKTIEAFPDFVCVGFNLKNLSEYPMHYRFGWHPAFRFQGNIEDASITTNNTFGHGSNTVPVSNMIEASKKSAYMLPDFNEITYVDKRNKRGVRLVFEGFNNGMIWTKSEYSGMFCIEPVTHLPDIDKDYFRNIKHETLGSFHSKTYYVDIYVLHGKE